MHFPKALLSILFSILAVGCTKQPQPLIEVPTKMVMVLDDGSRYLVTVRAVRTSDEQEGQLYPLQGNKMQKLEFMQNDPTYPPPCLRLADGTGYPYCGLPEVRAEKDVEHSYGNCSIVYAFEVSWNTETKSWGGPVCSQELQAAK